MASKSCVFRFDDVEVREREFSLTKAGEAVSLEPKAFRALLFLLRNPQRVISKQELLNAVWSDTAVTDGSLTRCIWLLRQVLGDDTHSPRYIETVATVGYRFIGKVEATEDASGEGKPLEPPNHLGGVPTKPGRQKRGWVWALVGGSALALCLAATIWYLHRPMPPPRITGYTQITHDGIAKTLVATDGIRLYFTERDPPAILQSALSGGGMSPISVTVPQAKGAVLLDVSPDGSSFLVAPESFLGGELALWNVRFPGGSARRLGDVEADDAAFFPGGKSVVYSDNGAIWLIRSDGTGARKLASVGGDIRGLAWSPDGATIRFTRDDMLWEMSSNGSNSHPLLPGWQASMLQCCGRWTPDGKLFLFLAQPKTSLSGEMEIWALDERPGLFRKPPRAPIQLTTGPIRWGRPILGKDGNTIFAEGITLRGELSRFDTTTRQFQPLLHGISAQGVAFSNDGESVAYVTYPEGILWKANRDGSNPVQLTDPPMNPFMPRWSPNGSQIAFEGDNPDDPIGRIYIVSSDGGGLRKLLPAMNQSQGLPHWSPDGHKMVFQGDTFLYIFDLDSRQVAKVSGSLDLIGPRWSPDGRYLVAGTQDELNLKIFNFKTQKWSVLPQKGTVASSEWSRDSQFIYFRRPLGDRGVFRIRVTGGEAERVVDLRDWHDAGWFGRWMALDPTDAPLLLRDIGSNDTYALTLDSQ